MAGYFFGREAVTGQITGQIQGMIGGDTASDIENIIANATQSEGTTLASILGIATLLFGAEFTRMYANRKGHTTAPSDHADSTGGQNDNGAIVNKKKEGDVRRDVINK